MLPPYLVKLPQLLFWMAKQRFSKIEGLNLKVYFPSIMHTYYTALNLRLFWKACLVDEWMNGK